MTSPGSTILRQRLARLITRRVGSSTGAGAVAAAARVTHDDLVAVLDPLISSAGVQALWGRAFDLTRREFPVDKRSGDDSTGGEPFARMTVWLEGQSPSEATEAAAAMFATFAELLTALIGGPLTTRYLEKAWPDGFSDPRPKRKKS